MEGILPFNPPRVQVVQGQENPWNKIVPNLLQTVVGGAIMSKIKQKLEQEPLFEQQKQLSEQNALQQERVMRAGKGQLWNDQTGQWEWPAAQDKLTSQGVPYIMGPSGDIHITPNPLQAQTFDLEKIKARAEAEKGVQRAGFINQMEGEGHKFNSETGLWEYAKPEFSTDPNTGYVTVTRGKEAKSLPPLTGDVKFQDVGGGMKVGTFNGHAFTVPGSATNEDGSPKTGFIDSPNMPPEQKSRFMWTATGPNTFHVTDVGKVEGALTDNQALERLGDALAFSGKTKSLPSAIAAYNSPDNKGLSPSQKLNKAINAVGITPADMGWTGSSGMYKTPQDVKAAFKAGKITADEAVKYLQPFGYK